jgi:3D (Asp-Asp-Asp) domain-containing protein
MMRKQVYLSLLLAGCAVLSGDTTLFLAQESTPRGNARTAVQLKTATAVSNENGSEFDLPEPTAAALGQRLTLWSTFYHVLAAQNVETGQPLLAINGEGLGAKLSARDWCGAAMEGTVLVLNGATPDQTFNFADRGASQQVDCTRFFPHVPQSTIKSLGKTRFELSQGPFGTGVQGMILVPYRTIAVDKKQRPIPFGTVIYIPAARGKEIKLPSGEVVKHDGYFFAADTGGLIKTNHIDVFSGINSRNPFPQFIKSDPARTFKAFIINDPQIVEKLRKAHRKNS